MKNINFDKKVPYVSKLPALVLMSKWPANGRCKQRLGNEIGHTNAAAIQSRLTKHTIAVAKTIEKLGLAEVQLSISGLANKAARRWSKELGLKAVFSQGDGDLGI